MDGMPGVVLLKSDRVPRTIVEIVRKEKAPEVSIPRTLSGMQVVRGLTPSLYRWAFER